VPRHGLQPRDRKSSPIAPANLLNDRLLTLFAAHAIPFLRMLTDRFHQILRGCRATIRRFQKTVLNEFYRVAFRKRFTLGSITSNRAWSTSWRPQQGPTASSSLVLQKRRCQTFVGALAVAQEKAQASV
jgi:hypothetical protein